MAYRDSKRFCVLKQSSSLSASLELHQQALLIAPPGGGKSSALVLSLLQNIKKPQKIILLQPRRLAAKNAAAFMAELYGEKIGQTIGYQIRFEKCLSKDSRIIVMTEGLFCKLLIEQSDLADIALVIFDEFHERNLESDFALALLREIQQVLRPDLQILIMSATLNSQEITAKLRQDTPDLPVLESRLKAHPLTIRYEPPKLGQNLYHHMADVIIKLMASEQGAMLAFLPGQREIENLTTILKEKLDLAAKQCPLKARQLGDYIILPLYGALPFERQRQAIISQLPKRKIVLATSIAETSLTLADIAIVIDSGLIRKSHFSYHSNINELIEQKISLASADQRAGRAARNGPGLAVRLWPKEQNRAFRPFDKAKILQQDIRDMILQALSFGVSDIRKLPLLDYPEEKLLGYSIKLLKEQGLISEQGQLSREGRASLALPFSYELALFILRAQEQKLAFLAALMALIISDRSLMRDKDLLFSLSELAKITKHNRKWHELAAKISQDKAPLYNYHQKTKLFDPLSGDDFACYENLLQILLTIFKNQIAKAGTIAGQFIMANGGGAYMEKEHHLAKERYLLILNSAGQRGKRNIILAASCQEEAILANKEISADLAIKAQFCPKRRVFNVKSEIKLGKISLKTQNNAYGLLSEKQALFALKEALEKYGLAILPWGEKSRNLYHRLLFLQRLEPEATPPLDEASLIANCQFWLWSNLQNLKDFAKLSDEDLKNCLLNLLPYENQQKLAKYAPSLYEAANGKKYPIIYSAKDEPPTLRAPVSAFYGTNKHPMLYASAKGATKTINLRLELLSPAQRLIQITQDLAQFWQESWHEVRKAMKARYPKHHWPLDPSLKDNRLKNNIAKK